LFHRFNPQYLFGYFFYVVKRPYNAVNNRLAAIHENGLKVNKVRKTEVLQKTPL